MAKEMSNLRLINSAKLFVPSPSLKVMEKKWDSDRKRIAPPPHRLFCEAPSKKPHGLVISIYSSWMFLTLNVPDSWGKEERIARICVAEISRTIGLSLNMREFLASQTPQITSRGKDLMPLKSLCEHHSCQAWSINCLFQLHCKPANREHSYQTSFINLHSRKRWMTISSADLHSIHHPGSCLLLFCRLS